MMNFRSLAVVFCVSAMVVQVALAAPVDEDDKCLVDALLYLNKVEFPIDVEVWMQSLGIDAAAISSGKPLDEKKILESELPEGCRKIKTQTLGLADNNPCVLKLSVQDYRASALLFKNEKLLTLNTAFEACTLKERQAGLQGAN